jgi:hypothetical protein
VLTISLPPSVLGDCLVHLDALAALRHHPPALHRPDIVGRLSLLFGQLGLAVAQPAASCQVNPDQRILRSYRRCACWKPTSRGTGR